MRSAHEVTRSGRRNGFIPRNSESGMKKEETYTAFVGQTLIASGTIELWSRGLMKMRAPFS